MNRLWNALAGGLHSLSQIESDIVKEGGSGVEERRQHAHFGIEGIDCRTTIRKINVISGVQLATGVESEPRDLQRVRSGTVEIGDLRRGSARAIDAVQRHRARAIHLASGAKSEARYEG